jgi:HEPN domain-containing protein
MKAATREWLKAACDDLAVIDRIIPDENLSHIVAFHAQQAVEKLLKAIIEEREIEIPKIHKLKTLFSIADINLSQEDNEIVQLLDSLYIEARYPGELGLLPNGKPSIEDAQRFSDFAKERYHEIEAGLIKNQS